MLKILSVFGTRPEAIKMAPVIRALAARGDVFEPKVCVTAQHRGMLDQTLELFGVVPDFDLNVMTDNQSLTQVAAAVLAGLEPILTAEAPDWVLIQGDTTTTAAATLGAFHAGVKVAHVEAGLRTYDVRQPFPEEVNRRIVSLIADLHFAATDQARQNLLKEGVDPARVLLTGNPIIDALQKMLRLPMPREVTALLNGHASSRADSAGPKLILVTAHRRENFGRPLGDICEALRTVAQTYGDEVHIVYPVHDNPNVRKPVTRILAGVPQITLTAPVDYLSIMHLANAAYMIVTDSGGLQEEAPTLGKPVLVLRNVTERSEVVEAGLGRVIGTEPQVIVREISRLLNDTATYLSMSRRTDLFGDGKASQRIAQALASAT